MQGLGSILIKTSIILKHPDIVLGKVKQNLSDQVWAQRIITKIKTGY